MQLDAATHDIDLRGRRLWAPRAWVQGGWRDAVLLTVDAAGRWADVAPGVAVVPGDAVQLAGPVLPGLVDAHSHAFQRAFAGLTERLAAGREHQHDDFWSWRDRMYGVANLLTPESLRAIAAQLYVELLHGGYTHVCEFHYVQHGPGGVPYDDPLAMGRALADAAGDTGIGLTVLPVLYERAGFGQPQLHARQARFRTTASDVIALRDGLRGLPAAAGVLFHAGVAIHSLRAATPAALRQLVDQLDDAPVHIHIAEQTGEVDDCLAATGQTPIAWLAAHVPLDARWQLVHATHATAAEIDAVAASGAGVVLCPTTEADLGDGLPDLPRYLAGGVPLSLGSDSQVQRDWPSELRLLEWAQRLHTRRRNTAATLATPSTAARLFDRMLHGGGAAAGWSRWGLQAGARADLLVVDTRDPPLLGVADASVLDALVFSGPGRPFSDVLVGGRWAVRGHVHPAAPRLAERFAGHMGGLQQD